MSPGYRVPRSGTRPLLSVQDLSVRYRRGRGPETVAVDRVSFDVEPGEVVGLVGESGSGKSTIASAVAGALPARRTTAYGRVWLDDVDLLAPMTGEGRYRRGQDVGTVGHRPSSRVPASVGTQLTRVLRRRGGLNKTQARDRAGALLHRFGMPNPESLLGAHPGQLSNGMRQRALIAIALARRPRLLIADEPTTALDTTVQAQLLELLREIVTETGTALLLLTHDLAVAAGLCDRIDVICAGRLVEGAERHRLLATPRHPYTHALIGSVPRVEPDTDDAIPLIRGSVGDHLPWTEACAFAPRCPRAIDICRTTAPQAEVVASRLLRCHNPVPATSA